MSAQDSFAIMYSVFAVGFTVFSLFVLAYILGQSDQLMEFEGVEAAVNAIMIFDYLGVGVVVASTVSSIFLASRIKANPLFLPVSAIFLGLAVTVSYFISLIPEEMAEHTAVAEIFDMMGLTGLVLGNLHLVVLVAGFLGIVATYAFSGNSPGGGRRAPV